VERDEETETRAVARTIYGTILVTALVAGLSEDDTIDAWQILVSVTATTLVFWLAHVYAEVLSQRLAAGRSLSWAETRRALVGELQMVQAGIPAAIALGLSALGLYSTDAAVTAAIAAGVGSLFAYGVVLARREGATRLQTLLAASVNGAFGLVIVALKAFVH
jgi:voltage-gated potassium channel Kch